MASLPANWEIATTDDGAKYYYNIVTNETSWTIPSSGNNTEKVLIQNLISNF